MKIPNIQTLVPINLTALAARSWNENSAFQPPGDRLAFNAWIVFLVESMIWRDRNLKFGPNYDLEVDNLEGGKNLARRIKSYLNEYYLYCRYGKW